MSRIRTKGTNAVGLKLEGSSSYFSNVKRMGTIPNDYLVYDNYIPQTCWATVNVDSRESFTDTQSRKTFNSCLHTRRIPYRLLIQGKAVNKLPAQKSQVGYGYWQRYADNCGDLRGEISFQSQLYGGSVIGDYGLATADWASLVDQVGQQLDGHMAMGQNLLTDAIQIAQTVQMFKDPFGLKRLIRGKRNLTLSKLRKLPANAWLEYQFGWKNIYRDVLALRDVWNEVRLHQNFLKSKVGLYTSCSARNKNVIEDPVISFTALSLAGKITLAPRIKKIQATNCFSLDVRRTQAMAAWSTLDQVCSRLGARDLADALWDVVPFSFLVDWFTHLGNFLEAKSISWNSFDLRYVGYSRKVEHHGYCVINQYNSSSWGNTTTTFNTDPAVVQKTYQRTAGFPPSCSRVGFFNHLSSTQLADIAALVVQRI